MSSEFEKYAAELATSSNWHNATGIGQAFNASGTQNQHTQQGSAASIAAAQNMSTSELLQKFPETEVVTLTLTSNIVGQVPVSVIPVYIGLPNLSANASIGGIVQPDGSVNFLDPTNANLWVNMQAAAPDVYTQFRQELTSKFRRTLMAKVAVTDAAQYGQSFEPYRQLTGGEIYSKQWIMQNFRSEYAQQSTFLTIPFQGWEVNMNQGFRLYVIPNQAITISFFFNHNFSLSEHNKMHEHNHAMHSHNHLGK